MTETLKLQIPIYRETLHVFFGSVEDCQAALIKDGISEEAYTYLTEFVYCELLTYITSQEECQETDT